MTISLLIRISEKTWYYFDVFLFTQLLTVSVIFQGNRAIEVEPIAIAEISNILLESKPIKLADNRKKCALPTLLIQHYSTQRQFVIVNTRGTYIFSHYRPVDQLKQILLENNGSEGDIVRAFFSLNVNILVILCK